MHYAKLHVPNLNANDLSSQIYLDRRADLSLSAGS